jgi:hypothetical protein
MPKIKKTKRPRGVDDLSAVVTGRFRLKEIERKPRRLIHPPRWISEETLPIGDIERRVMRACQTIRVLPDKEWQYLHGSGVSNLPVVREFKEAYGYVDARTKFIPTPRDVSDCLTALSWCNVLERYEFRLIWWRSFGISFGQIAARMGKSDETARGRYRDALMRVYSRANSTSRAA